LTIEDEPPRLGYRERSPGKTLNHIRRATECDLMAISTIFENAIRSAKWLPDSARKNAEFATSSVGEEVHIWCGRDTGVQGFVSVWKPESFVHHLYVAPSYQGRGVGTALLASLADWLPRPWTLKCANANVYALSFYLGRGWNVVGDGDGEHGKYSVLKHSGEPSVATEAASQRL